MTALQITRESFTFRWRGVGLSTLRGQSYPMQRGVLIRVGATTKRRIVPGAEGMTLLMLSDRPDSK
jgi:hypothetical protein